MTAVNRVIVIGLDGLEPTIVDPMLGSGQLPNLAQIQSAGAYSRIATTYPAQTPVAWSTFATGRDPGGHGIFDFIYRDPETYLPDLSLSRYEQSRGFLPPKAVNRRGGVPVWNVLSAAGVPSTVLRCPCTYPPDDLRGRMLSGMGVPDIRGGLGTATFYSSADDVTAGESENAITVAYEGQDRISTHLIGPRNPKTGEDVRLPIGIDVDRDNHRVVVRSAGDPKALAVDEGEWSDWLRVKFKVGMLQSVWGRVRFHLVSVAPTFELYASPINFDANTPMFPISSPWEYAGELARKLGPFYTTGMVEDHTGLTNGRFGEEAFLDQCNQVLDERERMMTYELERFDRGLFYCLFDTPDRVQHMFWRFREPDHPANINGVNDAMAGVIENHYRKCDAIVGRALEFADDSTLVMVLSDHGFNSFRRGFNINTWLHDNGFLALKDGAVPGDDAGELFHNVDWGRTKAYALGLGGIYLNLRGRESEGTVADSDVPDVSSDIVARLTELEDHERSTVAIRGVSRRAEIYSGAYVENAPDLVVNFAAGYRASWGTALGGIPAGHFEDNTRRWSGDHIIDPTLVPGVLFMNRPFADSGARLLDMAPTILHALGVEKGAEMGGESLLQ